MSDIHLEDYTEQYEVKHATADTMIFDGGRRTELLNGELIIPLMNGPQCSFRLVGTP